MPKQTFHFRFTRAEVVDALADYLNEHGLDFPPKRPISPEPGYTRDVIIATATPDNQDYLISLEWDAADG